MADLVTLRERLKAIVNDQSFPFTDQEYEQQIIDAVYRYDPTLTVDQLPPQAERLVLLIAQTNMYYILAGKHAQNFRVRVEGDIEIHANDPAEQYLKLAMDLENRIEKELAQTATIQVGTATRRRVEGNEIVPNPDGSAWQ